MCHSNLRESIRGVGCVQMAEMPLHRDLQAAAALLAGLLYRARIAPMVVNHPVAIDCQAGAVGAPATEHEDRPLGRIRQYRQNLVHLLVGRREETGRPDAEIPPAVRFHCLSFPT